MSPTLYFNLWYALYWLSPEIGQELLNRMRRMG